MIEQLEPRRVLTVTVTSDPGTLTLIVSGDSSGNTIGLDWTSTSSSVTVKTYDGNTLISTDVWVQTGPNYFFQVLVHGNDGTDSITNGKSGPTFTGGLPVTLDGTAGNDTIIGGDAAETFWGGTGNDTFFGNKGNDSLVGQGGADTLEGGRGNDTMIGDAGNDSLLGDGTTGSEHDSLVGGSDSDTLDAEDLGGLDTLDDDGVDTLFYDSGGVNDVLV